MSLKKAAIKGVKWTSYATIITTALQFIQLAVLARLLSPEAFGLMAVIMLFHGFAQAYADMGISNALIHYQDTTKEQLSSLYWLNIFAGIILFLILFLSAPLITTFYNEPQLLSLIQLTSLAFLITPLGQQFQVLLQKELVFKKLAIIEVVSVITGTSIAIISALIGQGVYSIVWGILTTTLIRSLLLAVNGWKKYPPMLIFKFNGLHDHINFGLYQMGEKSINYFNSRLDQLVIGAFVGVQALGYYNLAFSLVIQPVAKINPIITRVAFPIFAKIQNDNEQLKKGYLLTLKIISFINFPILCGLAVIAPLLIPLVFGDQWADSIIIVQILSFVALLRSQGNPIGSLLLAKGRADLGFKFNAFLMILKFPFILIPLIYGGIIEIAWALLILQVFYMVLNYLFLVKPLINPSIKDYSLSLLPAFIFSIIMALGVYTIPLFIQLSDLNTLLIQVVLGGVIYTLLNLFFNKKQLEIIKQLKENKQQDGLSTRVAL